VYSFYPMGGCDPWNDQVLRAETNLTFNYHGSGLSLFL